MTDKFYLSFYGHQSHETVEACVQAIKSVNVMVVDHDHVEPSAALTPSFTLGKNHQPSHVVALKFDSHLGPKVFADDLLSRRIYENHAIAA